jgi:hypothetical protein
MGPSKASRGRDVEADAEGMELPDQKIYIVLDEPN